MNYLKKAFQKFNKANRLEQYICLVIIAFTVYLSMAFFLSLFFKDYNFSFLTNSRSFTDFFAVNQGLINNNSLFLNPYGPSFLSSYPPLALIFALPWALINRSIYQSGDVVEACNLGLPIYFVFFTIFFTGIFLLIYYFIINKTALKGDKVKSGLLILILLIFNAPMIKAFNRGNYILISVLLMLPAVLIYPKKPLISAILLALSSSLKIYPAVMFIMFLADKKFKEFTIGIFTGLFVTGLSFLLFAGSWLNNFKNFLFNLTHFASSEYLFVEELDFLNAGFQVNEIFFPFYKLIYYFILLGIIIMSYFYLKKSSSYWKKVFIVAGIASIFPFPVFLYNALFLLAPLLLFLMDEKAKSNKKEEKLFLIIFVFIFAPLIPFAFNSTINGFVFPIMIFIGCFYLLIKELRLKKIKVIS